MSFIGVLICTLIFVVVCKDAIKKVPGLFYLLALFLSGLYIATSYVDFSLDVKMLLFTLMQKGTLSTALFVIIMYMGVFRDLGFVKHRLMPIRATLSITACILILGHVGKYLIAYVGALAALSWVIKIGLAIAIACFILMLVLGITSFQGVKRRMNAASWIKLQKWAYLFYALVYVHLIVLLAPAGLSGADGTSAEGIIVYTAVFGIYAVLRIGKALSDRKDTRHRNDDKTE